MDMATQSRILVGVSGSQASLRALRWAAREASERGARLDVVLAWQPQQDAYYAVGASNGERARQRDAAIGKLAATLRDAFCATMPGNLSAEAVEGLAEQLLCARSAGASLLVLGSTSCPAVASGRSIGPVIRSCLGHACCPVVVVGPEQASAVCGPSHAGALLPERDQGRHMAAVR
jgi:nucleotide-binding universal stress UspA family protein